MRAIIAIMMSLLLLLTLSASAEQSAGAGSERQASPKGDQRRGEELYNASCVVCHGAGATGGIGPRLAGNPVLSNDPAFQKVLSEGRHMMPPLKDAVTGEQLNDIRAWLKTLH